MLFLFIVKNKKWKGNESCHTHECGNKVSKGQKNKRERWNIIGQRATAAYWVHNDACCTFSKWCQNIYIYSQHLAIQHLLTFLCTFYMDLALTEWQYVWWEAASYFFVLVSDVTLGLVQKLWLWYFHLTTLSILESYLEIIFCLFSECCSCNKRD